MHKIQNIAEFEFSNNKIIARLEAYKPYDTKDDTKITD